jgi:uncharacterized protein YcaQ
MEGDVMVSNREGFQKIYDLTERVLPSYVNASMPSIEEFAEHIIDQNLRCHGLVSLKGLTYLRRNAVLRKVVKTLINERLAQRSLEQVQVANGDVFILQAGLLESSVPRLSNRMKILSPFDNSVIQRERLKSLFQYDYNIECYVPAAKRQYGYFCLPLLYRDEFIGRMDCKAHRKTSHLEIKLLHFEQHNYDDDSVITAFVEAVKLFCAFQNCHSVSLIKAHPTHLIGRLKQALLPLVF